jgi:beta-glucosidase
MGWEIYPEGIYQVLKNYAKFKKPLFIMENGLADEGDRKRAKFITDHLKFVHEALNEGIDVRGYFHWSLMDNFEWAEGFSPKFGLYAVDRKTFRRSARPSAKVYGEICKNNEVRVD